MIAKIKNSELRIMQYMRLVNAGRCYVRLISTKLQIDYSYLLGLLASMEEKGWLTRIKHRRKTYYTLTEHAPKPEEIQEADTNG